MGHRGAGDLAQYHRAVGHCHRPFGKPQPTGDHAYFGHATSSRSIWRRLCGPLFAGVKAGKAARCRALPGARDMLVAAGLGDRRGFGRTGASRPLGD